MEQSMENSGRDLMITLVVKQDVQNVEGPIYILRENLFIRLIIFIIINMIIH